MPCAVMVAITSSSLLWRSSATCTSFANLDRARTPRSNGRRERRRQKKKRGRRVVRHPDLTAFPVGRVTPDTGRAGTPNLRGMQETSTATLRAGFGPRDLLDSRTANRST
eukprot:scaffold6317_cov98-Phaeocystis_antarctica.AAC.3